MTELQTRCKDYLSSRRSDYEFRCIRFQAVYEKMLALGMRHYDSVYDVGAGRCDFEKFLRDKGWIGSYRPVDGSIDGTDLEQWSPPEDADFFVAIELLEHLDRPWKLLLRMRGHSRKGMVITSPNPFTTDVLGMDHTHKTPIYPETLIDLGMEVEYHSLFLNNPEDTTLAWWKGPNATSR